MSKSVNAALLSALVFPGVGHLYLKSNARGVALLVLSAVSMFMLMSKAFDQAAAILLQLQAEGRMLDLPRVVELAAQNPPTADASTLGLASLGFLGCWFIGVVDAYRLGKR